MLVLYNTACLLKQILVERLQHLWNADMLYLEENISSSILCTTIDICDLGWEKCG